MVQNLSELNNQQAFERAQLSMPGGVNSPVRSFRSVGGTPYFVETAEGPYVWDIEKRRYVDYVMSYGPCILGHANPQVVDAVSLAAGHGTSYGAPTLGEIELAETLCERVKGLEMLRLVSSGTEAVMSAVRLARGYTGRDKIIKFAGNYHGHSDNLLAAGGSGVANQGLSGCDGVTAGAVSDTVVAPYNEIPEIDESVAVVCVEPIAANMGVVPPHDGFLAELRKRCNEAGALLLFDEVITGFRLASGGATEYFDVQPDIWCFGKVIGGGLPVGAYGASREVMNSIAPLGGVYQGGTLSGNPLATAAGMAVLNQLDAKAYDTLEARANQLAAGLRDAFAQEGVTTVLPQVGSLFSIFFTKEAPQNFEQAQNAAENGMYKVFFHEMLKAGFAFAPGPYETVFVSTVHTEQIIEDTITAARTAAKVLAQL